MMATKMNGFRKAVLVSAIVANFGMPLVGRAQEKSFEFPAKQDTISIEYNIHKQMKEREMAKENLRMEIEKIIKAQDSIQNRKESLVKLGEEAGYKIAQPETKKESEMNFRLSVVSAIALVTSCLLILNGVKYVCSHRTGS